MDPKFNEKCVDEFIDKQRLDELQHPVDKLVKRIRSQMWTTDFKQGFQQIDGLYATVEWIAVQRNLFFAECNQAEAIIQQCNHVINSIIKNEPINYPTY